MIFHGMAKESPVDGEVGGYYTFEKAITRHIGKVTFNYSLNENIDILAGGQYASDRGEDIAEVPAGYYNGKNEIAYSNVVGFAQGIIKTKIVNMTVGGRFENHSQYGSAFAPRIAFRKVMDKFHAKLLISQAFRTLGIDIIDYNAYLDPINLTPTITPENMQVLELETGYKLSSKMFITANVFYNKVDDAMVYFLDEDGNEGTANQGTTGSTGFELEYRIRDKWGYPTLNYSYYTAKGINEVYDFSVPTDESALMGTPRHKVVLNSSIKIMKNLSINPSAIYLGGRYAYTAVSEIDELIISKIDPLVLANIFLNYRNLFTEGLSLGVGVYDLLDSNYSYIQPYNGWHAPLHAPLHAAGREFFVKLSYDFKFKE